MSSPKVDAFRKSKRVLRKVSREAGKVSREAAPYDYL